MRQARNIKFQNRVLTSEVRRIADSATDFTSSYRDSQETSLATWIWSGLKPLLAILPIVIAALFGLEQYLAAQHESNRSQTENLLSSASQSLVASHPALKANAVRTIVNVGQVESYSVPKGFAGLGIHIRSGIVAGPLNVPYFDRAKQLFRDFATTPREPGDASVSSALLIEGAAWEHLLRLEKSSRYGNTGSLLYATYLTGATAIDVDLSRIQFGPSDLTNSKLENVDCTQCGFTDAKLDFSNLQNATLTGAYFAGASLQGANFSFTNLSEAMFLKANTKDCNFLLANLTKVDFSNANLDGAKFDQSNLDGTKFTGASLKRASFRQVDVSRATFIGADLTGADFSAAIGLTESTLSGAINVSRARFPTRARNGEK